MTAAENKIEEIIEALQFILNDIENVKKEEILKINHRRLGIVQLRIMTDIETLKSALISEKEENPSQEHERLDLVDFANKLLKSMTKWNCGGNK